MTHNEMDELYELYSLGALENELAVEIDSHLVSECAYCLQRVHEAVHTTATLSGLADPMEPPREVRERILNAIGSAKPKRRSWSIAIPVLVAACLALLAVSLWTTGELNATRTRLTHILDERDQLRSALEIMSRSQTRTVQFGTSDQVAHGRVFVNPRGGFVVVGSDLPPIAADRTFQLWLVPTKGSPEPAGLFRANPSGGIVYTSGAAVNPATVAAVAVTVEPSSGSRQPTTKPFLVVPLA